MPKKAKTSTIDDSVLETFAVQPPSYVRTGVLSFDMLSGGKGFPYGAFFNVIGASSLGKSTALLSVVRNLASQGLKTLYVASEYAEDLMVGMDLFNPDYQDSIKVVNTTMWSDAEKIMRYFFQSDKYNVIVFDSIQGFTPDILSSGEKSIIDPQMAIDGRMRALFAKVLAGNIRPFRDKLAFTISQVRANFNQGFMGEEFVSASGETLKFFSRGEYWLMGQTKVKHSAFYGGDNDEVIGTLGYIYAPTKSGISTPLRRVPILVLYGVGVSNVYSLLHWGMTRGRIESAGAGNYTFLDFGQTVRGKQERNDFISDNSAKLKELFYADSEEYFKTLVGPPTQYI